tara:strand:+ start:1523 stop:2101 length:579 start_codon:yes stop_codon:yes gene_type:complete
LELLAQPEIWVGAGVLLTCLISLVIFISGRNKKQTTDEQQVNLTIAIEKLPLLPVINEPVRMEIYGSPVRIRALVISPIGRGQSLPEKEHLGNILNHFIPDFMRILELHQPIFRKWPEQLSSNGFIQSFFNNLAIPNKGQGTVWCSIAGKIEVLGSGYLIGMVCNTATPNSLSQITVQHPGQWLDILRVHQA